VAGVLEWTGRDRVHGRGTVVTRLAERVGHQPLPDRYEDDGQNGKGDAEARNLLGHGALVVCWKRVPASGACLVPAQHRCHDQILNR
jgi:hypothetical protein